MSEWTRTSQVRVKICGLCSQADCLAIHAASPDYAGFVFAPGRHGIIPDQAGALLHLLPEKTQPVGVFTDQSAVWIVRVAKQLGLAVLQLHGTPDPERILALRDQLPGTAIWQCLPVEAGDAPGRGQPDPVSLQALVDRCEEISPPDVWLADSKRGQLSGGTGLPFAWTALAGLRLARPLAVAGGLAPHNVREAIAVLRPAIVDCSSSVETDGHKDSSKVSLFCREARHPGNPVPICPLPPDTGCPGRLSPAGRRASIQSDRPGRFGPYGGRYAAEILMPALTSLEQAWQEASASPDFQAQYRQLLRQYAGRPSLLYEAKRLSADLDRSVWLKREDLNHTGSHKINNVLGQVLLAQYMGKSHLIAETGAGQHGVATATAAALFGMTCDVYMGDEDMRRQSLNVFRMQMLGSRVHGVASGTATLKDATSEAMRAWSRRADDAYYVIGSVMGPHPYPAMVRNFQRIIGDEIKEQILAAAGRLPAALIACVGGGSNAMGTFYPFLEDAAVRLIGAEAGGLGLDGRLHAATMAKGSPGVFHGMHSLFLQEHGQISDVHSISAGLDYPGIGPEHAWLQASSRAEYHAVTDAQAVDATLWLSRLEGIIPALESAHAVALLRRLACQFERSDPIVVTISGRGDKDVASIRDWLDQHTTASGVADHD